MPESLRGANPAIHGALGTIVGTHGAIVGIHGTIIGTRGAIVGIDKAIRNACRRRTQKSRRSHAGFSCSRCLFDYSELTIFRSTSTAASLLILSSTDSVRAGDQAPAPNAT